MCLLFGAGYVISKYLNSPKERNIEEQSKVLLEKIQTVAKLITVEGNFSEVYNYKDFWAYDFFPFQKKAILLVDAKVSVGYDLKKMNIQSDAATKTVTISSLPEPEFLSIDHNIKYYDISEGTFNSFSPQDYTQLQEKVKEFVRKKAEESDLKNKARLQGNQMIEVIRFMVESAGWKFKIDAPIQVPQ
jgi:Protein of unknown function (DUF4230)